ncbi:MAG: hypothetical protein GY904_15585 [Planctomycetaceae bacterium]|nr:hypothetical protein [Planctomycetaceae bacterium]
MAKGSLQPKHRRIRRRRLRVECLGQRRLLAAITGSVFEDANHSSQREVGELNAPQRLIYIDANDNATLDADERFVVGETDGTFEFDGLTDGDYLIRLFNGTSTQTQTTPLSARIVGTTIAETNATQVLSGVASPLALTDQSLVVGDPTSGQSELLPIGNDVTKMQRLPDGRVLAIGTDTNGPTAWVIDPVDDTVTPIDFSGGSSTPWSELAIDGNGRGVLLDVAIGQSVVRSVDATDPENAITSVVTNTTVPTDTQVLTSSTGSRSVFAWNSSEGVQASLWSNVSSNFITSAPVELNDSSDLLTFDDASGLLATRNTDGGVTVYDVDANFATLHTLNNVTGPVVIDGARELLLGISPIDTALKIINLRDGTTVADLALDLSAIGTLSSVALAPEKLSSDKQSDVMVVLGTTGFAEIVLDRSTAHKITVDDGVAPAPILFGVAMAGSNVTPEYEVLPSFQTREDNSLWAAAPGALQRSFDADGDHYALVQQTPASHGSVTARPDGSFLYIPNPNFNGIDTFKVALHDGRDISDDFDVQITVIPVPDAPEGIILDLPPISELVLGGAPVGTIEIIDADGGGHNIVIDDPRFVVEGDDIIFVGGDIDFENEPEINLTISVTDLETDEKIEKIFAAQIREESAILEINPDTAEVIENQPGETVVSVSVTAGQNYSLTLDDSRFELTSNQVLKLKDGIALDYETEQTVVVNVTATGETDGQQLTEPITISVIDVPEAPTSLALSNQTVLELHPGDVVGKVLVDGLDSRAYYELYVDDPRFEIVDGTLKLLDNQIVERSAQSEIELTITAELKNNLASISETFIIEVRENDAPYHNHDNPYDVDHNGLVTAADALVIINFLNNFGPGPAGRGNSNFCYDVNADSLVTALDALLVLNELARIENGSGTVGGEGETNKTSVGKNGNSAEGEALVPEGEFVPLDASSLNPTTKTTERADFESSESSMQTRDPQTGGTQSEEYTRIIDESITLLSDE